MEDLQTALGGGDQKVLGAGSCSALIKLLPGYQDLYSAHDTWSDYETMLRIMKKYMLNLKDSNGERRVYVCSFHSFLKLHGKCWQNGERRQWTPQTVTWHRPLEILIIINFLGRFRIFRLQSISFM